MNAKFFSALTFCLFAFAGLATAQTIEGLWYVKGDSGPRATAKHANKDFAVVEIKKQASDGTFYAVVKEALNSLSAKCTNCAGENANKNTVGMTIAKGFKPTAGKPGEWEGGWAINPETGLQATGVKGKQTDNNSLDLMITLADGTSKTLKLRRK